MPVATLTLIDKNLFVAEVNDPSNLTRSRMPPRHSPGFFPFLVGSLTFLSLRLSSSLKVVGDSLYFLDFTRCIVIYMADLSAHPEDPFFLGKKP